MALSAANPVAVTTKARGGGAARKPFGEVLRNLLIEQGFTTSIGNPNWSGFAQQLGDIQYETLRKAVTREREPSIKVMEKVAEVLGVEPTVFWEYQLAQAQRMLDPREVGEDEAFANLQKWLKRGT